MSNAIQQLLEKFLALTNEEQTIFFNVMVASRSTPTEKERILWEFIETNDCISRCYDMSLREAVPLMAA